MPLDLATIVRRRDFTADLFVLWLQPQHSLSFTAGQYVTIGVGGIERPYSIVSAPNEKLIELFIERVPPEHGGMLTPILHGLRLGDVVTIRSLAKGLFTLNPTVRHHVMVATVTGIAPYVSMIRQAACQRARTAAAADVHFYVLHGASFADEFVYDRELLRRSEADPLFIQYVASVSRPSAERNARWRGAVGRVNEILEEQLRRWSPPRNDTVIYLCGHPGMIADVEERLVPQGWSIAQEQYWVTRAHHPRLAGA